MQRSPFNDCWGRGGKVDTCPWRVGIACGHISVVVLFRVLTQLSIWWGLWEFVINFLAWEFVNNFFRNLTDLPYSSSLTYLANSRNMQFHCIRRILMNCLPFVPKNRVFCECTAFPPANRFQLQSKKYVIPGTILGARGIYRCTTQGSYP